VLDFATLAFSGKPNQYLITPEGFPCAAKAHRQSPVFNASVEELEEALLQIIAGQPRTEIEKNNGQTKVIQRSALFRFPDTAIIQVVDMSDGKASAAIFSTAKYGRRDFGVNKKRVDGWMAALEKAL